MKNRINKIPIALSVMHSGLFAADGKNPVIDGMVSVHGGLLFFESW